MNYGATLVDHTTSVHELVRTPEGNVRGESPQSGSALFWIESSPVSSLSGDYFKDDTTNTRMPSVPEQID